MRNAQIEETGGPAELELGARVAESSTGWVFGSNCRRGTCSGTKALIWTPLRRQPSSWTSRVALTPCS